MNYRRGFVALGLLVGMAGAVRAQETFQRGDVNRDRSIDITDPIFVLSYIFAGQETPRCGPIANANADSSIDISDAIFLLAFLFSQDGSPPSPLTPEEILECETEPPPPPPVTVLRHGFFRDFIDPPHNIEGSRVEELSNKTLRLTQFRFDGLGFPQVVIRLTKGFPAQDRFFVVSGDLLREEPYVNESFTIELPQALTSEWYDHVEVWCDYFPLTYAYARLRDGPFP